MQYRRLGTSGLKVSEISFGSWVTFGNQIDMDSAKRCMTTAYDAGVNFFDNAEVYAGGKSEEVMGELLASLGWRRDSYIVSSKVFWGARRDWPTQYGLSFKHVREACDQALERLGVDYLDLYFCHRADPETPMEETVRAMNQLIQAGKILYWGTSEWTAAEIATAHAVAQRNSLIGPTMEQPQYHLFHRHRFEVEYGPVYDNFGMGTTIWSPLAQGLLTGKYNDGIPADSRAGSDKDSVSQWIRQMIGGPNGEQQLAACRDLKSLADDLGISMAHLAIAWCLKNPRVSTAITGASRPEQVEQNVKAGDAVAKMTDEVMKKIDRICAQNGADTGVDLSE